MHDGAHWASANNASRLGVSGEVTGQGLAAFLDLQTGVAVDAEDTSDVFTLRHFLAGVRGGFGALAYTSPAVAGFRGNASVYVDPDTDHDYNFGIAFQGDGLEVGVQFYNANGHQSWPQAGGINRAVRTHARYSRGDLWSLGASHERMRGTLGGVQSLLYVAGTLNPSSRVSISGSVGHVGDSRAVQVNRPGFTRDSLS